MNCWWRIACVKLTKTSYFKWVVHPKIFFFEPSGHARCRWVCFFIETDLVKFSIYIICSPMDPLQWMGAVRMRADKNITKIHTTLVHQLTSCEAKSLPLRRFNFKPSLLAKIQGCYNNNASFSQKVHPLLSSHIKIHLHICFWTVFTYKQCLICAYFSPDSDKMTFSLEKAILWIDNMDIMDLFLTNMQLFTSQDVNWWTGVVWITCGLLWCFISCLDSHSDGTHSLQRIHWWASDVMLLFFYFFKASHLTLKNCLMFSF